MKRRSGFTLVEMAVVIVIVLILAALLIPVFRRANKSYGSCSSNLKQVGIAFMQYAQDSGEQYPRVVMHDVSQSLPPYSKPFGWADALQPYVKTTNVLQCPTVENTDYTNDATQRNFSDYWMNTNCDGAFLKDFASPAQTILCGDGNDGSENTNARYTLNVLPPSWISTEKSPARRHLDTANYLFADGHVKSLRPQSIDNLPTAKSFSTFSIR